MTTGLVSIVGAGPGDPELLTCRALQRLQAADLVVYDGLVPDDIVRLARSARLISASRRAGQTGPSPSTVATVLIDAARRGQRVVRLRAGDPFVLARGAEEALALADAGVPFEVVPGLTTASAAPALAGIPLTHRGMSSGFVVVSGHAEATYGPILTALPANVITVVVLMGLAERARIAQRLVDSGWRRETPAAIAINASHPNAQKWIGTLASLNELEADADAAGVIVIGEVVSLAKDLVDLVNPVNRSEKHGSYR
jgi:uroporphyrin-III C-methyltransferase/precorrin-2 dehydrogenase/sirohydrochlorin ferrochelatase